MSSIRSPFWLILLGATACSDKDPTLTSINAAPSADITSHTRLQDVYDAYTERFEGVVSDADHELSDLLVTWYLGGREICEPTPPNDDGTTACETIVQLGDEELELYVEDAKQSGTSDTLTLTVNETGTPQVNISVPTSDGYYYADVPITFVGTVSDAEDAVSELNVYWISDVDGNLNDISSTPSDDGVVSGTGYLSAGNHMLSLMAEDTVLKLGSDTVEIQVAESNSPPECSIRLPADGTIYEEGDLIQFEGFVSDADVPNAMLTATIESDISGVLRVDTPEDDGDFKVSVDDLPIASHTITLTAVDEIGSECSTSILVHVGTPPTVTLTSPTDGDIYDEGTAIPFIATVSDGEDTPDSLSLSWWSDIDGEFSTEGADADGNISFEASELSVGTHSLLITATDSHDMSGTWEMQLVVNAIPSTPEISISPDPAFTTDDLIAVIEADSTDEDGDTVSYLYDWTLDGTATSTSSSGTLTSDATQRDETWTLTVTPTDGITTGVPATAQITISNTDPAVSDVTILPDPAYADDELSCSWTYADDDDDDDNSTVIWLVDGAEVGTGTTLSNAFVGGQDVTCTVTPFDGTDAGSAVSTSLTITNTAPVLASVSISPDPAYEADTLSCDPGETSDIDGTTSFTYLYSWTVDGADTGTSDQTLTGDYFDRDQSVVCTATPQDGDDNGDAVDSAALVISNTTPEVSDVTISPDPAYADDTLSCSWTFSDQDDDSDSSTVEWTVDGTSSGTEPSLSGTFVGGQEVSCTVTANDGTDTGTVASTSLWITNTAPVLANVTLTPEEAYEGDTLDCTPGETTDIDGTTDFTYSYAWKVDGTLTGTTDATLSSDYFDRDQEVSCIVTPNDGQEDGLSVESNILTILNTAPSISNVTLSPDPVYAADLLVCSHHDFEDIDGDADDSTYAWTLNGSSIFAGYDLSGVFVAHDVITCTVTPSDGDDEGESITATITVTNTPPVLASVSISPDPAYEGDVLSCDVGATTDDDGTTSFTYSYSWTVNGGSVAPTSGTLSSDYWNRDDEVTCTAIPNDGEDDGDAVASDSIIITNTAPVVSNVEISPAEAYAADGLTCTYDFSDADNDSDTSTLAWTVDGVEVGTDATLSGEFVGGNEVACTITPNDGTDEGTDVSTSIIIINTPPVLADASLAPDPAYEADTITCTPGDTSDDDGTTSFSYAYSWTVDGNEIEATDATLTGTDFDRDQVVVCTVVPNDGEDDGDAVSTSSLTISNTEPSIDSVDIDPSDPVVTTELTCSYAGYDDDDDDADQSHYSWTIDGVEVGTNSTLSDLFVKDDVVVCTVTPYDGTDEGEALSASTTITNTPPVASNVAIDPEDAYAADTLLCSYDFSDDDNDDDVSTYSWTIDGVEIGTEATLSDEFVGGDIVTCTVTPNDGEDNGTAISTSVTIINTPPVLASVSLSPDPAYENDTLTCIPGDTIDDDGTVGFDYTYSWTVDGADVSVTDDQLDGSHYDRDQEVICTVIPNDGTDDGDAVSSSPLTISNTEPYIGTVSIEPDTPVVTDTLDCSYADFGDDDNDADESTYSWTIDGVIVGTTSELSGVFVKDDVVTCTVTPNDGTDAGTPISEETTIVNTPPEIVDIGLSPDAPETDQTITVSVSTSDDDNDEVSLTYEWTVDGVLQSETSDSLSGDYFDHGEVVMVAVTPNDGEEDGDVASISVTIANRAPTAPSVAVYLMPSASVGMGQGTHGCLVDGNDQMTCWGADDEGQVSDMPEDDWLAVATGQAHSCGVSTENRVWCWGWDNELQTSDAPTGSKYEDVALGNRFSCALANTGRVDCWGRDTEGQASPPSTRYDQLEASYALACGRTNDGEIECWGSDTFGQLSNAPTDEGYTDIGLGTYHACAINADDEIECWGCDAASGCAYDYGQVDDAPAGDDWTLLAVGAFHSCAMDVSGDVTCWGMDDDGQATPEEATYINVWAGADFTCGLTMDGGLICWGANNDNQVSEVPDISGNVDDLVCLIETPSTDDDDDDIDYVFTWDVDGDDFIDPTTHYWDGDTVPFNETLGGETWTCTVTPDDGTDLGDSASDSIVLDDCNTLQFDGTDDYVEMVSYPSFSHTSDFSVELWFKPDTDNAGAVLVWGADWEIQLCGSGSGAVALEAEFSDSTCSDIRFDEWNFLAASWDLSTGVHQIYLNGAEMATTTVGSSLLGGVAAMYVGRGESGNYFNGQISDLAIFDTALSITEMEDHFRYGVDVDSEADLVGYWAFDEGAGSIIYDSTSFFRDGSIVDGNWAGSCPDE